MISNDGIKYRYIVGSDLDGTLLARGEIISPENMAAIKEMKDMGVCFVPNSGRTISEMPESVLENPYFRYYIGADGGIIWDKETGETVSIAMSREEVGAVLDLLYSYPTLITARSGGISYADADMCTEEKYAAHRVSPDYGRFIDHYVKKVGDFKSFVYRLSEIEMMCVFFADDAEMAECKARIEALGEFSVASSESTNLEIFHKRAGKGNTLLALADLLGVPHERTIAVGDSRNDLDMIKKAGISLAMANGTDELKAAADRTICYCHEHSAKYILENIID